MKKHKNVRANAGRTGKVRHLRVERLESRRLLSLQISEFQASNDRTLEDFDGDSVDWLEIHNAWPSSLNLSTWYLTDDPLDRDKWSFPNVTIAASGYLVVYCSGKDVYYRNQVHTSFALDADGGYLALVAPDGQTVMQEIEYPPQYTDISFGPNTVGIPRHFAAPTPGKVNGFGLEITGEVPYVRFSHEGGTFVANLTLELTADAPGTSILYTTDGTMPKSGSASTRTYSAPITLTRTTFLRACTIRSGEEPGPVVERTYIGLGSDLATFSSNLPLVAIDTLGAVPNESYYRRVASAFVPAPEDGRTSLTGDVEFVGAAGIRLRGSSSLGFAKKQYAFETWGMNNDDLSVSLFGLPAESDWVLYAPYSDKSLIRNYLAYKWAADMGQYAPRTQFFELFMDTDGDGILTYSDYLGVYLLVEKIKRDPERVDVAKLSQADTQLPEIAGGYIVKRDRADPGDVGFVTSIESHQLYYVDPKENEINSQQKAWLASWFREFETVLHGSNYDDPEIGYAAYIDVLSFVDHFILNEGMKNIDGFRLSQFFYLDRGGKLVAGPIWDFNLSMGNADYNGGQYTTGWYYPYSTSGGYRYYPTLFRDPNFTQAYIDRLNDVRHGVLSTTNMWADIDEIVGILQESQRRNFEKWRILGVELWPNYYVGQTFADEINFLKNWLRDRFTWLDNQYLPPTVFSESEGIMEVPFDLTLSSSRSGKQYDVYYTLDGTDPRVWYADDPDVLISKGAVWKYLDDGSNQDSAWRMPGFDDSAWKAGPAELGYGDGDEATVVGYGPSASQKYATTYFRTTFEVEDWTEYDTLALNLLRDDGAIVYINGIEVKRLGLLNYGVDYSTYAYQEISGTAETTWEVLTIPDAPLISGTNTLAVEIHQSSPTSSDMTFDLELLGGKTQTGGVAASARRFDGTSLHFGETTVVTARAFDGTKWSGLMQRVYAVSDPGEVRITEIMYNPQGPRNDKESRFESRDFEYLELTNTGDTPAWFVGYSFLAGVEFTVSSEGIKYLAPGQSAVVVSNREAFVKRYGSDVPILGEYSGNLSNSGETVVLLDHRPGLVHYFVYGDSGDWPRRADGQGGSLEIVDPGGDYMNPANWRDGAEWLGSPGTYFRVVRKDVVINEVLSSGGPATADAIELYNTADTALDISGWFLTDSDEHPFRFRIPDGTVLEPGGYVVFTESDFNPGGTGFCFSDIFGGKTWLIESDASGEPVRFADHVAFKAAASGESFVRWPNGSGDFYPAAEITLGDENAAPRVGPVVISEIHYLPSENGFEFVEIHNPTTEPVDLTNWHLGGGIDYLFGATVLEPGGSLVVVGFDPGDPAKLGAFQAYVGDQILPTGPFLGDLVDSGERLLLERAHPRPPEAPYVTPYTMEDAVDYGFDAGWPVPSAGESLHRITAELFGNAGASWSASGMSAGEVSWISDIEGDLNGDGFVGTEDLDIIRANWGRSDVAPGNALLGDPSGDGAVGTPDLDIVRANWGSGAAKPAGTTPLGERVRTAATDAVWAASAGPSHRRQAAEAAWLEELSARRRDVRKPVGPALPSALLD